MVLSFYSVAFLGRIQLFVLGEWTGICNVSYPRSFQAPSRKIPGNEKRRELLLLEMVVLKSSGTDRKFSSTEPWPAQEQHVRSDLEDREGWRVEWGLLLSGFFVLLFCPQYWDCCETISFSLFVPFHHSIPYNGTLLTAFNSEVWRKDGWVWIAGGYLRRQDFMP